MNLVVASNALLAGAIFFAFALPGFTRRGKAPWVIAVLVIALEDSFLTLLPGIFRQVHLVGGDWNWTGKILSIAAMLCIATVLISSRTFTRSQLGLTVVQAPGTNRVLLRLVVPYLFLCATLALSWLGNAHPPTVETILYQASMPGLAEELAYRGVLLALFDRIFVRRFKLLGFDIGYGAIAVTAAFALLHGMGFDETNSLRFSWISMGYSAFVGFVLVWLRARTQSLVVPIGVHNLTNLILESVPKVG